MSLSLTWPGYVYVESVEAWEARVEVSVVQCVAAASTLFYLFLGPQIPAMALFAPSSILDLSDDVLLLIFSSLRSWDLLNLSR